VNTQKMRRRSGLKDLAAVLGALLIALTAGLTPCLFTPAHAAGETLSLDGSAWRIAPQAEIPAVGEQISTPGYKPLRWMTAQVPGTVFGAYVLAGREPEPTYADNAYKVDRAKYDRSFWYRTEFRVPAAYRAGIWLNLAGVNRDADIYVNGKNVGAMHGFMQRGRFDLTPLVHFGSVNALAVLDYVPNQPPGKGENYSSPAFICSVGWDWMPRVPGLNMGIYKGVYLSHTGPVSLANPWVRTDLPALTQANLSVQVEAANDSGAAASGTLSGLIEPGSIRFDQPVSLAAGETRTVTLSSETLAALRLKNPKLWWPNGYGSPNLYTCRLAFRIGGEVSDAKTVTFGIKKYTYDTNNHILHFHVNGVPVFPKGGSWGMSEFMLRCNAKDYDTKVRFHKELNFNMIRNWLGMTPDEAFYAACDKYGIMVWDEFWLNSSTIYGFLPADVPLFKANAIDKIKTFRNHPCIALWCAENEATPPPQINDALRADVHLYDGDDRYYQENSHAVNLSGSGPWNALDPKQYFQGVPIGNGDPQPFGMRSEIGTATFTSFDSFKKFMPEANWWPYNEMWNQHFFGKSAANAGPDGYENALNRRYGPSRGIQEYCAKAQFLNLETMKALYEGWLDHSDKDASGVLIWMSQSAYPSFVWQTYDYYYDTTGAYWGAKTACEPLHVYWNRNDDRIRVVNTTGKDYDGLTAQAWIYNLDGTQKYHKSIAVSSRFDAVADCFTLTYPDGLSATHFIKLRLTNKAGQVVSENFYWRGTTPLKYTALNDLKKVTLTVSSRLTERGMMTASITNPAGSNTVAFAIRPKLVKPKTGEQVLPVFMNDGYFSLVPGETKHLTIRFDPADAGPLPPALVVECWNNARASFPAAKRDQPNGDKANLALFRPAAASSDEDSSGGPEAAVDDDPLTRWSSAWSADPQWLRVDLGKSRPIRRVKLVWEAAYAKSYQIQVSEDAVHWTDLYATTTGPGGTEDLTGLSGQGRYIRLYATQRATPYGYSLYAFEVYGPNSALPGKGLR